MEPADGRDHRALLRVSGPREVVYSNEDRSSRGDFLLKRDGERLFALIGSRWCRVERRDGKLFEVPRRSR